MNLQPNSSEETWIPDSVFDKKVIYVTPRIPEGVIIKKNEALSSGEYSHYGIFATKEFKKGDILWSSFVNVVIDNNRLPSDFVFNIPNIGLIPISSYRHMLKHKNFIEYFSFDCLINHNCNPNSLEICTSTPDKQLPPPGKYSYDHVALKDICVGEEITCNYLLFNQMGEESEEGFACKCGYEKCYEKINGFYNLPLEKQKELAPLFNEYQKNWWYYSSHQEEKK